MKNLFLTLILILAVTNISAQGKVLKSLKMKSNILNKEVSYSVYLPAGFEKSTQSYPVIYLLHGYGNDETTWINSAQTDSIMDKAVASGAIPPAVILMPNGENTWYVNAKDKSYNWEDMFLKEFMPYAEKQYKINGDRSKRIIWGASMGGFAAMRYAMLYPDKFATCVAFSPAIYPDQVIGDRYPVSDSPLHLIENIPANKLNTVAYFIDCGDKDFLYWGNASLHIRMRDRNINHEFRMGAGKHGWVYWKKGTMPALEFISGCLAK